MNRREHPADETLVQYIAGELESQDCAGVEEHVETCSACAEALTLHAQFETALFEAGELLPPAATPSPSFGGRVTVAASAVLMMAAAVLLFFGAPWPWIQVDGNADAAGDADAAVSRIGGLERDPGCIGESTPEGITCAEPLAVALATFPEEAGWDSFSPDDGADMNWCAADDEPDLVCINN